MTVSSLLVASTIFAIRSLAVASAFDGDSVGGHTHGNEHMKGVVASDLLVLRQQQQSRPKMLNTQPNHTDDTVHSLQAGASANAAEESAQVAMAVAAHAEAMAVNASDALQFVRQALQIAQANGGGLEGLAARLESEVSKVGQSDAGSADAKRLEADLEILRRGLQSAEADGRGGAEAGQLSDEIKRLEDELESKYGYGEGSGDATRRRLEDLERQIAEAEANGGVSAGGKSLDELKAEVETLKEEMANKRHASQDRLAHGAQSEGPEEERTQTTPSTMRSATGGAAGGSRQYRGEGGVEVDSSMPFGGVEPFGREDAAEDLTKASIAESNGMVDQLEKAQGAEGKRAVFRALTHLRGGMMGAYDGIAKAHLGNVDRYNSEHNWRKEHPYHHLAEEESDVGNWAFKSGGGSVGAPSPASAAPPSSAGMAPVR